MLPFQPVPGAAEIVLNYQLADGRPAVNTFGVQNTTGAAWSAADLNLMCAAFSTWWGAGDGSGNTYRSRVSNLVTLVDVTARDLTVDGSTFGAHADGRLGQATGTALPNGVSFVMKSTTGLTGRSRRGRTYLVGLTTDSQHATDKNQALAAAITVWGLAFNALPAAVVAYGGTETGALVVISRYGAGVRRSTGITTHVTGFSNTDSNLDYQRGRAPGH